MKMNLATQHCKHKLGGVFRKNTNPEKSKVPRLFTISPSHTVSDQHNLVTETVVLEGRVYTF